MRMKRLKSFKNEYVMDKNKNHEREIAIKNKYSINPNTTCLNIQVQKILKRKTIDFYEKDYNRPQCIFNIYLRKFNITIFGRKMISPLFEKNLIQSINCSMITSDMIIGILNSQKKVERDITISYYPLHDGERRRLFEIIKEDRLLNIEYPFKYYEYFTNQECDSPANGWKVNHDTRLNLFNGEEHLRKFTIKVMKQLKINSGSILFDPACSTGDFLYEIKKEFPNVQTIGQDLSKEMVECAKSKIDITYCGDSLFTSILDDSVNFVFLRFLNSKVVTTPKAEKLYNSLIKKVKKDGYIICFGHTPVLLSLNFMKKNNLKLLLCNGYDKEYDAVFQYYVFQKYE